MWASMPLKQGGLGVQTVTNRLDVAVVAALVAAIRALGKIIAECSLMSSRRCEDLLATADRISEMRLGGSQLHGGLATALRQLATKRSSQRPRNTCRNSFSW